MAEWRAVITDTESPTGVAQVCPAPDLHCMSFGGPPDDADVLGECCVGPFIECWDEDKAKAVAALLTEANACEEGV